MYVCFAKGGKPPPPPKKKVKFEIGTSKKYVHFSTLKYSIYSFSKKKKKKKKQETSCVIDDIHDTRASFAKKLKYYVRDLQNNDSPCSTPGPSTKRPLPWTFSGGCGTFVPCKRACQDTQRTTNTPQCTYQQTVLAESTALCRQDLKC